MRKILAALCCAAAVAAAAQESAIGVSPPPRKDILAQLPLLAPRVVAWAEQLEAATLAGGMPLDARLERLATANGVREPSRVRIVVVDRIPLPGERELQAAALSAGLPQEWMSGLTIGYAVLVRHGFENDPRVLSHELRHVAQYEQAGGVRPFLAKHLVDLAERGYDQAPFELDARAHERATFAP